MLIHLDWPKSCFFDKSSNITNNYKGGKNDSAVLRRLMKVQKLSKKRATNLAALFVIKGVFYFPSINNSLHTTSVI